MKKDDKKYLVAILFMIWLPFSAFFSFIAVLKNNLKIFLILTIILTCIELLIYIIVVWYWKAEEKYLEEAILHTNIEQVDNLSPFEFEEWVARFLRIAGYKANSTKKSGDYGVDVLAENDHITIAIQVKKFSKPVGIKAVQEVIAGMDYYNCYEGWVVTTAPYFTQAAKNLAKSRNIKLYNKNDLAIMLYELQKTNNIDIELLKIDNSIS